MTKAARTTQCTLFTCIPKEQAWSFNALRTDLDVLTDSASVPLLNNSDIPYTREIFDALCMRFEEPHGNSRWDSPLFVALPEDTLDLEGIYKSLYETRPLPPNQSTQNVSRRSLIELPIDLIAFFRRRWAQRITCSRWTLSCRTLLGRYWVLPKLAHLANCASKAAQPRLR